MPQGSTRPRMILRWVLSLAVTTCGDFRSIELRPRSARTMRATIVCTSKRSISRRTFLVNTFVDAIVADVKLPETSKSNIPVPVNVKTAPDAAVGGPLWLVQQVRFGEAFNTTQNIAPFDPATDKFEIGSDDYYSSVLRAWNFEPKLKMHTNDFQIAAFKPSNWMGKTVP